MRASHGLPTLLLAALAGSQIPIPAYTKTTSSTGETHGFWFRAPDGTEWWLGL